MKSQLDKNKKGSTSTSKIEYNMSKNEKLPSVRSNPSITLTEPNLVNKIKINLKEKNKKAYF